MNTPEDVVLDRVVARIAEELDVDTLGLDPLADVVDPEMVGAFVEADGVLPESEIRFRYEGCDVLVAGDGAVSVEWCD
jgi:hypothetical protein